MNSRAMHRLLAPRSIAMIGGAWADAAVAASDSALVQDQINLFKALGGGWGNAG